MIGLVLAGGGAKGAYQIGAWQALREHGIKFDVVAGASIGALNSALVASDDLEKAQRFWRSLTTAQLARIEPLLLAGLVIKLLSWLVPSTRYSQLFPSRTLRQFIKYELIIILILTAAVTVLAYFMQANSALVGFGFSLVLLIAIVMFLPDFSEWLNGSLVSRAVLLLFVDQCVDWDKIATGKPSVFVTVARAARLRGSRRQLQTIPDYVRLDSLEMSDARSCLAASMAVPFGIFPRIEIGDRRYVDGGVADNIPVFPVILEGCNKIYVVHLSPKPRFADLDLLDEEQMEKAMHLIDSRRRSTGETGLYGRNWFKRRLETLAKMRELGLDQKVIEDYFEERFDRLGDGNVEIVHIVPQRRLGFSLVGTLHFSRAKTERLLARGYEDAKATLSGLRPPPAKRPDWEKRSLRRTIWMYLLLRSIPFALLGVMYLVIKYFKSR